MICCLAVPFQDMAARPLTTPALWRQVPTDAEVVATVVEDGRVAHTAHPLPPSSFHDDCAAILGPDSRVRPDAVVAQESSQSSRRSSDC